MKLHKRRFGLTILAGASVLALGLSGCSSAGGGDSNGKVTVNMVESLVSESRTALLKDLIAEYEADNPKVHINLISPPTEQADQKIRQMLQSGKGIDVLESRGQTISAYLNNDLLLNLTKDVKAWKGYEEFNDRGKREMTVGDDNIWVLPYGFIGGVTFYRTDLSKAAGFSGPPVTWSDMLEQASKINDPAKNTYGYAFRGGNHGNNNLVQAIHAYVADDIDLEEIYFLKNGKSIFTSPKAKDAVDMYFDLFEKASPPSAIAWGYPEMVEGFTNGSTAFLIQTAEVISIVENSSLGNDKWGTFPVPLGPTGKAVLGGASGGSGWAVAKSSKAPKESLEFIEWLTTGEAGAKFAKGNSVSPALTEASEDPYYTQGPWGSYVTMNEDTDTFMLGTSVVGLETWFPEWELRADADIQKVLLGQSTKEEMLAGWIDFWKDKHPKG